MLGLTPLAAWLKIITPDAVVRAFTIRPHLLNPRFDLMLWIELWFCIRTNPPTKNLLVAILKSKPDFATHPLHFTPLQKKLQRPILQQHCCILPVKLIFCNSR